PDLARLRGARGDRDRSGASGPPRRGALSGADTRRCLPLVRLTGGALPAGDRPLRLTPGRALDHAEAAVVAAPLSKQTAQPADAGLEGKNVALALAGPPTHLPEAPPLVPQMGEHRPRLDRPAAAQSR